LQTLRLKVVERIVRAWIMTLPSTAAFAFSIVWLCNQIGWMKF